MALKTTPTGRIVATGGDFFAGGGPAKAGYPGLRGADYSAVEARVVAAMRSLMGKRIMHGFPDMGVCPVCLEVFFGSIGEHADRFQDRLHLAVAVMEN